MEAGGAGGEEGDRQRTVCLWPSHNSVSHARWLPRRRCLDGQRRRSRRLWRRRARAPEAVAGRQMARPLPLGVLSRPEPPCARPERRRRHRRSRRARALPRQAARVSVQRHCSSSSALKTPWPMERWKVALCCINTMSSTWLGVGFGLVRREYLQTVRAAGCNHGCCRLQPRALQAANHPCQKLSLVPHRPQPREEVRLQP